MLIPTISPMYIRNITAEDLVSGVREMNRMIAKADSSPTLAYVPPKRRPLTPQQQKERIERLNKICSKETY